MTRSELHKRSMHRRLAAYADARAREGAHIFATKEDQTTMRYSKSKKKKRKSK